MFSHPEHALAEGASPRNEPKTHERVPFRNTRTRHTDRRNKPDRVARPQVPWIVAAHANPRASALPDRVHSGKMAPNLPALAALVLPDGAPGPPSDNLPQASYHPVNASLDAVARS